jgi:hypothetical protein
MKNVKLKQKLNLYMVIVADPNLSDGAKSVAGALLFWFHNTKSGSCFPENVSVADIVGLHPKTVSKHIGELVRAGYVFRDRRYNSSCITDFNWAMGTDEAVAAIRKRLKDAKKAHEDARKNARGNGTKSRRRIHENVEGNPRNRYYGLHENGTLTRELNTRTENREPNSLRKERETRDNRDNQEEVRDTNNHDVPETVIFGVEHADIDPPSFPTRGETTRSARR